MIEHDDTQDHWKDLAEQLGLPPEGESAPAAKTTPALPANAEERTKVTDVRERVEPEPKVERSQHTPASYEAIEKVDADEPDLLEKQEETSIKVEEENEQVSIKSVEVAETSPFADEMEDTVEPEKEEIAESEAEEPSRGPRRRGGRGGKGRQEGKGGRTREPGTKTKAKAEPSEKKEAATAADEEGGDDIEDLSDLTVPSWQELIGSLYRPER
jgi:hypothetical protein